MGQRNDYYQKLWKGYEISSGGRFNGNTLVRAMSALSWCAVVAASCCCTAGRAIACESENAARLETIGARGTIGDDGIREVVLRLDNRNAVCQPVVYRAGVRLSDTHRHLFAELPVGVETRQ